MKRKHITILLHVLIFGLVKIFTWHSLASGHLSIICTHPTLPRILVGIESVLI